MLYNICMNIFIHKATPDDANRLASLICNTLTESNSADYPVSEIKHLCLLHSPENMIRMINERQLFFAEKDGSPVGCAALLICKNESGTGQVTTVFVDPKFQNIGVGRTLMYHIERTAAEHGIKVLRLESSLTAYRFYLKLGYKKIKGPDSQSNKAGLYPMFKNL